MTLFEDIQLKALFESNLWDSLLRKVFDFGLNLIICLVIYWGGRKLIKYLDRLVGKIMSSKDFDSSVASFLKSLINIILTAALLLTIVNILGINTTSLVALLASIGVALGMALSGTLQNFAGGVMILLFRPYKVDDYILAQGQEGTVKEIQIFNTVIVTADNRTIYIPNGGLSTNTIINYNNQKNRRIEWVIGVDYGTDYDKAKKIIQEIIDNDMRILADPAPFIALKTLNESSVDLLIRVWVAKENYWDVYFDINEQIYKIFADKGINIPFPQLTVHLADRKEF
ncbi:MAG: mechanosensitive ion channel [Dysgonamonadaceae bacterium]|jgi:small conductance mechanosensitive channel|nr:mechanosensitive ion channel [Dysgonamonadaceae bacterium]